MKYRVIKVYKYTEEVIVEADSSGEAECKAQSIEGERNYDDWLFDCNAIGVSD